MEKKILLYEIFLEKNSSIKGRNCGVKKKKKKKSSRRNLKFYIYSTNILIFPI